MPCPYTTWRLAKMNLALRGIDGKIEQGDSFTNDRFPDLKANYILARPPFNMKHWGGENLRGEKLRYERSALSGGAMRALISVRDFRR